MKAVLKRSPGTNFASWDACVAHSGIWLANSSIGRRRRIAAGVLIYAQGSRHPFFYLIRQGFVQTAMTHETGRRLALELMGPGSIFGEGAAFDGSERFVDAWATTDCELTVYAPDDIRNAGTSGALLFESLIKIMGAKQRILAAKLLQFSNEDPQARMRALLARLVSVQRRSDPSGGARINQIWISQEQLGEMCGMSRVSAARALRRLADGGLVSTHPKYVEVLDAALLEAELYRQP